MKKNESINFDVLGYTKDMLAKYNTESYLPKIEYAFDSHGEVLGLEGKTPVLAGLCDPINKIIHIYVGVIARVLANNNMLNEKQLKRHIKLFVRHECRHSEQFEYLKALDEQAVVDAVRRESLVEYGKGRLERDANSAMFGFRFPLSWMFRKERMEAENRKWVKERLEGGLF